MHIRCGSAASVSVALTCDPLTMLRSTSHAATVPPASIAKQASRDINVVKHVYAQLHAGQDLRDLLKQVDEIISAGPGKLRAPFLIAFNE